MANGSVARTKRDADAKTGACFSIADAKAHFSEVVSSVANRRQPVTILRRGRPVAQIVPMQEQTFSLYGSMRGTVVEVGDIVGPTGGEWSVGDQ